MISLRMLTNVAGPDVLPNQFSHLREKESTLNHADSSMDAPMACDHGVVVSCDNLVHPILRHEDLVIGPKSTVFVMLASILLELVGVGVEEVLEDVWVLQLVIHPLVEQDPCWYDETSNDVSIQGGRRRLTHGLLLMHSRQDVCHNIQFSGNVRDGQIEFLKSVKPSNLSRTRLCCGVQVSKKSVVGGGLDLCSAEVMLPFIDSVDEGQELLFVGMVVDVMLVELPRCASN